MTNSFSQEQSSEDYYSDISDMSSSEHKDETSEEEHDPALTARYATNDLRNVMFETLADGEYALGKLGNIEVVMLTSNGFVNVTKICKSVNKDFFDWKRSEMAQDLFQEIIGYTRSQKTSSRKMLKQSSEVMTKVMKGKRFYWGTYVHPEIAVHVAAWCSAKYARLVSQATIIFSSKQAIQEKDEIIGIKDDKIDKLTKQIELQREESRAARKQAKKRDLKQSKQLEDQKKEISKLVHLAQQNGIQLDRMEDTLEYFADDRVVKGKPSNTDYLTIVKKNGTPDPDSVYYEYKALRVARRSKTNRINKLKEVYPDLEVLIELEQPNSVNLWQRFLDSHKGKIRYNRCDFNLVRPFNQKRMLRGLKTVHDERFDY